MVTKINKPILMQGDESGKLGFVHVVTGDGKGKTTSALGLALRALGHNMNVYMIQFLKSADTGELFSVRKHLPNMTIVQYGVEAINEKQSRIYEFEVNSSHKEEEKSSRFTFMPDLAEKEACRRGLEHAFKVVEAQSHDILILDEINCALDKELVGMDAMKNLIEKRGNTELVFTGRDAPKELKKMADYVSSVRNIKHPWMKGIKARQGIDY